MEHGNERGKKSFFLKSLIALGISVLILVLVAGLKEGYRRKQVQTEIEKLKQEARRLEKENTELADKLSYFESKDFQEREAKDKLSLQTPEENLVIIKSEKPIRESEQNNGTNAPSGVQDGPNWKKWWDYFFKY